MTIKQDGVRTYAASPESRAWAKAAYDRAKEIAACPKAQARNLRFGGTWFVGVDALPNAVDGSVEGVPLKGPWEQDLPFSLPLHRAQLSIIYPGYPQQDSGQSEANHGYRITRRAAHVDGLLPIGPDRRRFVREFHGYVLGVHLNRCPSSPTVVWKGSHIIMRRAFREAIGGQDISDTDLTAAYHAARNLVFGTCEMVALRGEAGAAFLLDRFALHGTEVWEGTADAEGRMVAFFRPQLDHASDWLHSAG